jgi:hypothetical protein
MKAADFGLNPSAEVPPAFLPPLEVPKAGYQKVVVSLKTLTRQSRAAHA